VSHKLPHEGHGNNAHPPNLDASKGAHPVPPPSSKLPRSARAALEPERVPIPKRRSKRVRHPLVIIGNAIFTVLVVLWLPSAAHFISASNALRHLAL